MEIKTKYNIRDYVRCNIYKGLKMKVTAIHIIASRSGVTIEYSVMWNGGAWSRMENELFSTEEELLKSL